MRVLQLADHYPPDSGGLALQVRRVADRLTAAGHQVRVVAAGAVRSVHREDGFDVRRERHAFARLELYQEGSPPFHPPWPDPEFARALRRSVREFRPEVIHAHGWSVFSAAAVGGAPLVVSLHDYGLRCPKKSLMRHGEICADGLGLRCVTCDSAAQPAPRRIALAGAVHAGWPWVKRRVSSWLAVSSYVRDRHIQGGIDPGTIRVVPPLVDALPPVQPLALRSRRPYVLYVGPGPEAEPKGRAVLVEAVKIADMHGHVLVLVGGRERLDVGPDSGIEDLGYLRGDALSAAFRGASLTVVPSVWPDPCPQVAVEAMSTGQPIVASDIGGLPDIVEDEVSGLLVRPRDVRALAGALARLLGDGALRERLGAAASASVSRYASAAVLPALEREYERAITDRRR